MSGSEGRFVFMSLPAGSYDLTVSMQGFKTASETGIVLERGAGLDVPVRMEIGQFEETITVTSVTPIVDTRSSTVDTTFNAQLLAKVPTARNPFYDLALTAPGMSSVGAEETWLPSPSAYGSANSQNITLVNGVDTTNPRGSAWGSLVAVNYNTVEEVKVLSLGAKAEYGNYSGAAIDVITKSGGNEYHGDVSYYSQVGNAADNSTTSFGKSWLHGDPSLEITTDPVSNKEPSVTMGGPIMRDRLWFYIGVGRPQSETLAPLRTLPDIYKTTLYDAKLTGEFGVNHRAWLGLHYEDSSSKNGTWGNGWDASMVYDSKTTNFSPQLQYQWVASPTNIVGFKYLAFKSKQTPSTSGVTGHPGYINWWKWLPVRDMGDQRRLPVHRGAALQPTDGTSRLLPLRGELPRRARRQVRRAVHQGRGQLPWRLFPGLRQLRLPVPVVPVRPCHRLVVERPRELAVGHRREPGVPDVQPQGGKQPLPDGPQVGLDWRLRGRQLDRQRPLHRQPRAALRPLDGRVRHREDLRAVPVAGGHRQPRRAA